MFVHMYVALLMHMWVRAIARVVRVMLYESSFHAFAFTCSSFSIFPFSCVPRALLCRLFFFQSLEDDLRRGHLLHTYSAMFNSEFIFEGAHGSWFAVPEDFRKTALELFRALHAEARVRCFAFKSPKFLL
jgi:hypothetical protein